MEIKMRRSVLLAFSCSAQRMSPDSALRCTLNESTAAYWPMLKRPKRNLMKTRLKMKPCPSSTK
jgi:hypothetical protein